jgi:hypothetical protein
MNLVRNAFAFFTRKYADDPVVAPCAHPECYEKNYFNTCGTSEPHSDFVYCPHNYAVVTINGVRKWTLTPYYLMSIESVPENRLEIILAQQQEMIAQKAQIQKECEKYSHMEMKIRDEARHEFIWKYWNDSRKIPDSSHPRFTSIARCDTKNKDWPENDCEQHCPDFQSWCITSLPYPAMSDAAFDELVLSHDGRFRTNSKGEKMVDFCHKYPRKGCWYEFLNGYCNGKTWNGESCTKMHNTFYGDASIPGLTRPNISSYTDDDPDWRAPRTNAVTCALRSPTSLSNWRTTPVLDVDAKAAMPTITPTFASIAKTSLTAEGATHMRAMILAHIAAGEPIPVNPKKIVDAPTDPFLMSNLQGGEWADWVEESDEAEGLEYLCLKQIEVMKSETFFGPGVHAVSAMRSALTDFLKTV